MDIYSFFSVLISKSLQIRAIFLFFWRTTADRLYIWKLICLLCTKLTGILDIHGTFFSIWKIGELCKLFCGQIPPFYAENGYWERIFFYMSKHWPRGQPVPAAPGNLRQPHRARRGNLCPPDWHLRPGRRLLPLQTTGIFTCFPRNQRNSILNN